MTLISQYFPTAYAKIRCGKLTADPEALVCDRIQEVLQAYYQAAGDWNEFQE